MSSATLDSAVSMTEAALRLARRIRPRRLLALLAGVMAFFLVLDFGDARGFSSLRFFDLNGSDVAHRINLSALVSGTLFLCAAALAFAASNTIARDPRAGLWFKASAALFALFGIDEILGIHTWAHQHGVSWTVSYLPFVAVATLTWLQMAQRFESRRTARRCAVAVGAFLGACVFDAARAGEPHSYAFGELLEMGAASLFVVSLVMRAHQYRPLDVDEQGRDGDLVALASFVYRLDPVKLAARGRGRGRFPGGDGHDLAQRKLHAGVRREQGAELCVDVLGTRAVGRGPDVHLQRRLSRGGQA